MFTSMICNEPNTVENDIPPIMNNFQVYRAVNFLSTLMLDAGQWTLDTVQCANKIMTGIAQLSFSAVLKIGAWDLGLFHQRRHMHTGLTAFLFQPIPTTMF